MFVLAIEHFNENKASRHKQRQFNCFLALFYFLSIISAFVVNIMSVIEEICRLRICLFRFVTRLVSGNLAKRDINGRFHTRDG